MKEILATLIGSFLTCTSLYATITERDIVLREFNACTLRAPGKLFLSMGQRASLRIKGDEQDVNSLDIDIENEELSITTKKTKLPKIHEVEYHLSAKNMQRLSVFGQGIVTGQTPIQSDTFILRMSGDAQVNLNLNVNRLVLDQLGDTTVELQGKAKYQDLVFSGNGIYNGFKLQSEEADVAISGNGKVNLNVKDILRIKVNGKAIVRYKGTPTITKDVAGELDISNG